MKKYKPFVREVFDPIKDFYKMRDRHEKIVLITAPFVLALLCYMLSFVLKFQSMINYYEFANDIISQFTTILTLFVSFSMAYLSIIVTSASDNIEELKNRISERKLENKKVTLYQVLVSEISYTLIVEIFFLIFLVFQKFLISVITWSMDKIILSIDVFCFMHILIMMLVVVKNIYFSFWKPR